MKDMMYSLIKQFDVKWKKFKRYYTVSFIFLLCYIKIFNNNKTLYPLYIPNICFYIKIINKNKTVYPTYIPNIFITLHQNI